MPTSIQQLVTAFRLQYLNSFKWGTSFAEHSNGVYIISIRKDHCFLPDKEIPIIFNEKQIELWMANAPDLLLSGKRPTLQDLTKHLKTFWLPDESIIYIGKAERQTLSKRIRQFYNHKVGKNSPHKGGYWLKLLNNIDDVYVHLFSTNESHEIEEKLLNYFMENVSESTKEKLSDKNICIPFANLQLRSSVIKSHNLKNHCQ